MADPARKLAQKMSCQQACFHLTQRLSGSRPSRSASDSLNQVFSAGLIKRSDYLVLQPVAPVLPASNRVPAG